MKVRYIGDYYKVSLIKGKVYEVADVEPKTRKLYEILDETGEKYVFFADQFEIVEEDPKD